MIASLPCRPTPCRRRGRMRRPTASKTPALLKRQAARRRAMRYRQFRELAVLSRSLTSLLTTLPRYTRFKLRFTECICYYGPYPYGYATSWGVCAKLLQLIVCCLSHKKGRNVHFCKKAPTLAQMTFDRYLLNPDIGRTFWVGLIPSN